MDKAHYKIIKILSTILINKRICSVFYAYVIYDNRVEDTCMAEPNEIENILKCSC